MAVELPAFLTKKVGPLPVGAWLLIGGAGVGVVLYMKRRSGGSMFGGLPENEADNVYGVPVESPDDEYAPYTPPPSVTGPPGTGGYIITPLPYDPIPGQPPPEDDSLPTPDTQLPPVPRTCTQPTLPARQGGYPSAPNRECPNGWHKAVHGPCAGKCIRNLA